MDCNVRAVSFCCTEMIRNDNSQVFGENMMKTGNEVLNLINTSQVFTPQSSISYKVACVKTSSMDTAKSVRRLN